MTIAVKDPLDRVAELPLDKLQAESQGLRDRLNRFRLGLGRHFVDKQPLIDLMVVAAERKSRCCSSAPPARRRAIW